MTYVSAMHTAICLVRAVGRKFRKYVVALNRRFCRQRKPTDCSQKLDLVLEIRPAVNPRQFHTSADISAKHVALNLIVV